jgi:hypothetical protein
VGHAGIAVNGVGSNKKIYGTIEAWRNRPIEGEHPYVYLDGIVLKRSWAGEVPNVSLLVAIGVNSKGYRPQRRDHLHAVRNRPIDGCHREVIAISREMVRDVTNATRAYAYCYRSRRDSCLYRMSGESR